MTACCAPMTSLFMRDISEPVCVRVKNDKRLVLHVVEQRGAHVEDQALTDAGRVVALHERQPGVEQGEEHRAGREQADELAVLLGDGGVDQRPQDEGRHGAHHRGQRSPRRRSR